MGSDTPRLVLGSLIIQPALISATEDLDSSLFQDAMDRKAFIAISDIIENTGAEMIDPAALSGKLGGGAETLSYISRLTDGLYSIKPEVFASHVAELVKEKLTREVYRRIGEQCTKGSLDISDIKPLIKQIEIAGDKTRRIADSVREWVKYSTGEFDLRQIYREVGASSVKEQANVRQTLARMVKDGAIAHDSKRYGRYHRVEKECAVIDFLAASDQPIGLSLPMDLDKMANIYPGNIVVVAGEWEAGKTAWMLDLVKRNQVKFEIHYFSSEMGASELRERLVRHEDISLESWKFHAQERNRNFSEVIVRDKINIVDYLEVADQFYLVAKDIAEMHEKIGKGVVFVALQKGDGHEKGRGGDFSLEKPRLYVTLSKTFNERSGRGGVAKILKAKNWASDINPNGRIMPYKLIQGAKFVTEAASWEYPESHNAVKKRRIV